VTELSALPLDKEKAPFQNTHRSRKEYKHGHGSKPRMAVLAKAKAAKKSKFNVKSYYFACLLNTVNVADTRK
jgi:hypothetical protein